MEADKLVRLTEQQIMDAMRQYEAASPRDKVSLAPEVSKLADVLGAMWFRHEKHVDLVSDHPAVALVVAIGGLSKGMVDGH